MFSTQIDFLFSFGDVNRANEATFKFVIGTLTHKTLYLIKAQGLDVLLFVSEYFIAVYDPANNESKPRYIV